MYSDVDIRKHLGKHIGIFPLKEDNIQGSCVLLTASNLAWSVNSCASCVSNGKIKIAAHDTVIVLTDEVVYLGKKFAGYCMVRVSMLPRGIASICTPVKPGWIGHLFITLHNVSNRDYELEVFGGLVVMTIHRLNSSCKRGDPRVNSRTDQLSGMGIQLNQNELDFINKEWANDNKRLFDKMTESDEYKLIKKRLWKAPRFVFSVLFKIIAVIICGVLMYLYHDSNMAGVVVGILITATLGPLILRE